MNYSRDASFSSIETFLSSNSDDGRYSIVVRQM